MSAIASLLATAGIATGLMVAGAAACWPAWIWRACATLPGFEFDEGELQRVEDWPTLASPQ